MYKYFNAPFGAMLTGTAALIDAAAILRHQFGGGMLHAWESAAIALHFSDGFEERYRKAVERGNELLRLLEQKKVKVHTLDAGPIFSRWNFLLRRARIFKNGWRSGGS